MTSTASSTLQDWVRPVWELSQMQFCIIVVPQPLADYTLSKPNVYYVTMRQLLAWVQNPVPASQLTPEMLGCGQKGGRPGTLADGASKGGSSQQRRRALLL